MNWVAPIKDEETLEAFGEALKDIDQKYYILFELGIGTGLQLQDILAFKVKDVKDKKEIHVKIGKHKQKITFKVPAKLQKEIKEFIKDRPSNEYLILGHKTKNKPVSREQAYRVLRSAGHHVGLHSIGAQTMRKTYAYRYYRETGDIYHLQALFNHASPSITYRFIGEKPNVELFMRKLTPKENERSRYLLYLNNSGKKRLQKVIKEISTIEKNFDNPKNNDAFYGKVDCLLEELEQLLDSYHEAE